MVVSSSAAKGFLADDLRASAAQQGTVVRSAVHPAVVGTDSLCCRCVARASKVSRTNLIFSQTCPGDCCAGPVCFCLSVCCSALVFPVFVDRDLCLSTDWFFWGCVRVCVCGWVRVWFSLYSKACVWRPSGLLLAVVHFALAAPLRRLGTKQGLSGEGCKER